MRLTAFACCLGLLITFFTSSNAAEADRTKKVVLVEGRFGKALDARISPVLVDGNERYRQPPLTVECWAKLHGKKDFNILVANDPKTSSQHWEIYSYARTGMFSVYLPGMEPAEIVSETDICDGRWHYLAMTNDGSTVRLFVDGKEVKEQAIKPRAGMKPVPGLLTIGVAIADGHRIGCDGLIDDVRLSRVVRAIERVPTAELPHDPQTLGLWRFDQVEGLTADPAWTPPPLEGDPWERETDADWVDSRFQQMDTGPFLNATIDYPAWGGKARSCKATAIRVGDTPSMSPPSKGGDTGGVLFDRNQVRLAAAWTGAFLKHSSRRFGLMNTPTPAGTVLFATSGGPGWANPRQAWDNPHSPTAPLPRTWAKYKGLYLHGKHTVLSYTVGETEVLESPWVETGDGVTVLTRTVEVGASELPLRLLAGELPCEGESSIVDGVLTIAARKDGVWTAVALVGDKRAALQLIDPTKVEVTLPADTQVRRFKLLLWSGAAANLAPFAQAVKGSPPPADLRAWTKPGPGRWKPIVTRGEVSPDNAPYVIDTLSIPYDNPYKALMFISGLDFLPNGDIAVCTAHGDVWLVQGVDAKLEKLTWKRFATGLYQPLGLKVVDGRIHVLERGQLTRLHDLNDDGEADFYENLNNDWHTCGGEHSYDTCLEADPAGNFYFFKTGDADGLRPKAKSVLQEALKIGEADAPTGGCLLRVSRDGQKMEIFATGFRHPVGLSVSPRGIVTGADQQGNWMPATRLDFYRQDGFYGDMRTHHRKEPPATYDPPVCWLPREADNSAGGQVWAPPDNFGPLAGKLLHLSYGRCRLLAVLTQTDGDKVQGGVVDTGLFFLSGVMRGRFHTDGHLYVAGLRGWQTAARRDGCLQRVRYTGKPLHLPIELSVHADGIRATFCCELDKQTAEDVSRYRIEQWNYRWSAEYGSKHWSPSQPDRQGQDQVAVTSATLSSDRRSVFLRTSDVKPVMQMRIGYDLKAASGEACRGALFNTIHWTAPAGRQ